MSQVQHGDTVKVHYAGKLDDGTVFDTSIDRDPLVFTIGDGQILPGFEEAVIGMNPGESKTFRIEASKAYGPRNDEMLFEVSRDRLPEGVEPKIGSHMQIVQSDGREIVVTIFGISESSVTLDANHPLAGEDLTFDIQLLGIV